MKTRVLSVDRHMSVADGQSCGALSALSGSLAGLGASKYVKHVMLVMIP